MVRREKSLRRTVNRRDGVRHPKKTGAASCIHVACNSREARRRGAISTFVGQATRAQFLPKKQSLFSPTVGYI